MNGFSVFWLCMGVYSFVLFCMVLGSLVLSIRQRRPVLLLFDAVLLVLTYLVNQCICIYTWPVRVGQWALNVSLWFAALPAWIHLPAAAAVTAAVLLFYRSHRHYERTHITAMSGKEAVDSLPTGICVYLDGGSILMINRAMETFWQRVSGEAPASGERMRQRLLQGGFLPGTETGRIGGTSVVKTPEGPVFGLTAEEIPYGNRVARILRATEITELYEKTRRLRDMQKTLTELNGRLTAYNAEIVTLTAETELLDARMRLHDEMGADLLRIKSYILNGGTEKDRAEIEARLKRNVTFLLTGQNSVVRDEYELMFETAEKLGIEILISGELPQAEPQKHAVAAAIHECMTNTLRHAGGDRLEIAVEEKDAFTEVRFTNNGKQPEGEVRAHGGLASLGALVGKLPGGRMEIAVSPRFVVKLLLPKEVPDGLQSVDRG